MTNKTFNDKVENINKWFTNYDLLSDIGLYNRLYNSYFKTWSEKLLFNVYVLTELILVLLKYIDIIIFYMIISADNITLDSDIFIVFILTTSIIYYLTTIKRKGLEYIIRLSAVNILRDVLDKMLYVDVNIVGIVPKQKLVKILGYSNLLLTNIPTFIMGVLMIFDITFITVILIDRSLYNELLIILVGYIMIILINIIKYKITDVEQQYLFQTLEKVESKVDELIDGIEYLRYSNNTSNRIELLWEGKRLHTKDDDIKCVNGLKEMIPLSKRVMLYESLLMLLQLMIYILVFVMIFSIKDDNPRVLFIIKYSIISLYYQLEVVMPGVKGLLSILSTVLSVIQFIELPNDIPEREETLEENEQHIELKVLEEISKVDIMEPIECIELRGIR